MDKLNQILAEYSVEFGIAMICWWQADLDARVDAAPTELKRRTLKCSPTLMPALSNERRHPR